MNIFSLSLPPSRPESSPLDTFSHSSEVCKKCFTSFICSSCLTLCHLLCTNRQTDLPCCTHQHAESRNVFSFRNLEKERRQSLEKSSLEAHCIPSKQSKEVSDSSGVYTGNITQSWKVGEQEIIHRAASTLPKRNKGENHTHTHKDPYIVFSCFARNLWKLSVNDSLPFHL